MRSWWRNRVLLGVAVFLCAIGAWEFRLKPQFRPMYERGVVLYRAGQLENALREFGEAYAVSPNQVEVILMVGWTNLKLRRLEESRYYFARAQRLSPYNNEAQVGAVLVEWNSGRAVDRAKAKRLAAKFPNDADLKAISDGVGRQLK